MSSSKLYSWISPGLFTDDNFLDLNDVMLIENKLISSLSARFLNTYNPKNLGVTVLWTAPELNFKNFSICLSKLNQWNESSLVEIDYYKY